MSLKILALKAGELEDDCSGVVHAQILKGSHFQSPASSITLMPASREYSHEKLVLAKDSKLRNTSQL